MEYPEQFLHKELGTRFILKEKSIVPPTQYIGKRISQGTLEDGKKCLAFRYSHYIKNAVEFLNITFTRKRRIFQLVQIPLGPATIDQK